MEQKIDLNLDLNRSFYNPSTKELFSQEITIQFDMDAQHPPARFLHDFDLNVTLNETDYENRIPIKAEQELKQFHQIEGNYLQPTLTHAQAFEAEACDAKKTVTFARAARSCRVNGTAGLRNKKRVSGDAEPKPKELVKIAPKPPGKQGYTLYFFNVTLDELQQYRSELHLQQLHALKLRLQQLNAQQLQLQQQLFAQQLQLQQQLCRCTVKAEFERDHDLVKTQPTNGGFVPIATIGKIEETYQYTDDTNVCHGKPKCTFLHGKSGRLGHLDKLHFSSGTRREKLREELKSGELGICCCRGSLDSAMAMWNSSGVMGSKFAGSKRSEDGNRSTDSAGLARTERFGNVKKRARGE